MPTSPENDRNQIIEWRGAPEVILCDNGPEYINRRLSTWAQKRGIRLEHIQPGNLQQNAFIERHNRTVRDYSLGPYLFASIEEVQWLATRRPWTYNHEKPNIALGSITFKQKLTLAACPLLLGTVKNGRGLP